MSRAFVKEGDGEALDDPLPRPLRVQPCYMTAQGVAVLREELERLQRETPRPESAADLTQQTDTRRAQRRILEITQILLEAVPVDVGQQGGDIIRFGATIELGDDSGQRYLFQIVGEDEAAPAVGRISWASPLGRRLIGRVVGDEVVWQRPAGDLQLEILSLSYRDGAETP